MKNLAIMGCLTVGLLLVSSVSGSAQVSRHYTAHVPFDFTVGGRSLKAGDYTIGPAAGVTNQRALLLEDNSTGRLKVIGQVIIDASQSDKLGSMNFVKNSSGWTLQTIETNSFALNLGKAKSKSADVNVATAAKVSETQTILLQN